MVDSVVFMGILFLDSILYPRYPLPSVLSVYRRPIAGLLGSRKFMGARCLQFARKALKFIRCSRD